MCLLNGACVWGLSLSWGGTGSLLIIHPQRREAGNVWVPKTWLHLASMHRVCLTSWWFQAIWKNICQIGNLPQVGVKIQNALDHHPVKLCPPLKHHSSELLWFLRTPWRVVGDAFFCPSAIFGRVMEKHTLMIYFWHMELYFTWTCSVSLP